MPVNAGSWSRLIAQSRASLTALLVLATLLAGGLAGPARLVPSAPVASAAPAVSGPIGGYVEVVSSVAFDVESNGRIHVIWTGKLNPDFEWDFLYHSSSMDGINWTPYQILDYYLPSDPRVVADETHHLVHLVYRNPYDGIVHRTVTNGIVSAPRVVATTGMMPSLGLDPTTGHAYLSWLEFHMVQKSPDSWTGQRRSWYATWDGTRWTAPVRRIGDDDANNSLLAVGPGPKVMLAWFQQWSVTAGNGVSAGGPAVLRTAYSTDGASFPVRQQANPGTGSLPKDDAFLLAYSAADDKFYLLADQLMWPGHSIVHRYVWNGTWSAPVQVSPNPTGWASVIYVGSAPGLASTYYVYDATVTVNGAPVTARWLRTETPAGVLSDPVNFSDAIVATGLSGASAMKLGSDGKFRFVGPVTGQAGIFYARQ